MKRLLALCVAALACVANPSSATERRDGSHDFDFDVGRWTMHYTRLLRPLTGSTEWVEMDGVTIVRPVWGGRGNLAEVDTQGKSGRHELLALRLYDPVAREWNIYFATSDGGELGPPSVGVFTNGCGEFYDQERIGDRTVQVRFVIYPTSPTSVHSEQAFSDDGGKTWETNWKTDYSRLDD